MVLNRQNELLYDSRKPHLDNVFDVIEKEEIRPLRNDEMILISKQLFQIQQNMMYRAKANIYAPTKNEVEAAKTAISNIAQMIDKNYQSDNIEHQGQMSAPDLLQLVSGLER